MTWGQVVAMVVMGAFIIGAFLIFLRSKH